MNCNQVKAVLFDYIDDLHDIEIDAEIDAHLKTCAHCKQQLAYERLLKDSLRKIPAPAMPRSLITRIDTQLKEQGSNERQPYLWFSAGFGSALAAGLAAWLVMTPGLAPESHTESIPKTFNDIDSYVNLSLSQVQLVPIALDAPAEFKNVEITLVVPEHIEIDGYPGERELTWQVTLSQGRNLLNLPLIAKEAKKGEIVAYIRGQDKMKTFSIQTRVSGNGNALATFPVNA